MKSHKILALLVLFAGVLALCYFLLNNLLLVPSNGRQSASRSQAGANVADNTIGPKEQNKRRSRSNTEEGEDERSDGEEGDFLDALVQGVFDQRALKYQAELNLYYREGIFNFLDRFNDHRLASNIVFLSEDIADQCCICFENFQKITPIFAFHLEDLKNDISKDNFATAHPLHLQCLLPMSQHWKYSDDLEAKCPTCRKEYSKTFSLRTLAKHEIIWRCLETAARLKPDYAPDVKFKIACQIVECSAKRDDLDDVALAFGVDRFLAKRILPIFALQKRNEALAAFVEDVVDAHNELYFWWALLTLTKNVCTQKKVVEIFGMSLQGVCKKIVQLRLPFHAEVDADVCELLICMRPFLSSELRQKLNLVVMLVAKNYERGTYVKYFHSSQEAFNVLYDLKQKYPPELFIGDS